LCRPLCRWAPPSGTSPPQVYRGYAALGRGLVHLAGPWAHIVFTTRGDQSYNARALFTVERMR
ncbi:MAG: hypothetical protein WAV20_24815, partial [Blastocatellia bacterium]